MNKTIIYYKYFDLYEKLISSLNDTMIIHKNVDMSRQLFTLINELDYTTITSFNGARDRIFKTSKIDLIKAIVIKEYTELNFDETDFYKKVHILLKDEKLLKEKIEEFCLDEEKRKLDIREKTLNKCREDIIKGKQFKCVRSSYHLGDEIYAASDMGNVRKIQEDSILILEHPKDNKYKLMVLADGVAGLNDGETASNYSCLCLLKWFEELDILEFNNVASLQEKFVRKVYSIDKEISKRFPNIGTTLSSLLVCDDKSIICNVGDSRIYSLKDGDLNQLTTDQTLAELLYRTGIYIGGIDRNEMRFLRESSILTSCIGVNCIQVESLVIDNDNYDLLLLFSDGVTDCVYDDEIKVLAINSKVKDVAKEIVDYALNNQLCSSKHETIKGGKDNTSAIVYCKGSKI